jgi:hypothetical protein
MSRTAFLNRHPRLVFTAGPERTFSAKALPFLELLRKGESKDRTERPSFYLQFLQFLLLYNSGVTLLYLSSNIISECGFVLF